MSRRHVVVVLTGIAVSAAALALAQDRPAPTGTSEPPLQLFAEHGGAEVPVTLDQPVTIGGATFTLRARANRLLRAADFEVEYPKTYHFEYEDDDLHMWTLTGADAKLMVFVTQEPMEPQAFLAGQVEAMAQSFEGTRVEPCELALQGAALPGQRLRMTVAASLLLQEVYALPLPGGRALSIVLQDSPDDPAGSGEMRALRALVSKTFRRRS